MAFVLRIPHPYTTMSKRKLLLPSIILLVLLNTFIGCDSHKKTRYLYQKPELQLYDSTEQLKDADASVSHGNYYLYVYMPVSEFTYTSNYSFSLVQKAYATRQDYDIKPLEEIKDLKVITLRNYNTEVKAGANVTDSCIFYLHSITAGDSVIAQPKRTGKDGLLSMLNIGIKRPYQTRSELDFAEVTESFSFRLSQPPSVGGPQQFAIIFQTATPSQFGDTSVIFTINP